MGSEETHSLDQDDGKKDNKKDKFDPAKLVAGLSIGSLKPGIDHKEVKDFLNRSPHFELSGECVFEANGACLLIQDATLLGHPVHIWINYKPYIFLEEFCSPKAEHEFKATCLRDGWGKIFIQIDPEYEMNKLDLIESEEAALSIIEGLKNLIWGNKYADSVSMIYNGTML